MFTNLTVEVEGDCIENREPVNAVQEKKEARTRDALAYYNLWRTWRIDFKPKRLINLSRKDIARLRLTSFRSSKYVVST